MQINLKKYIILDKIQYISLFFLRNKGVYKDQELFTSILHLLVIIIYYQSI